MKKLFKSLSADTVGFWSFWTSVVVYLLTTTGILLEYKNLPPYLPLYNHMPWGYERLGTTPEIFIPIGTSILITIANIFLAIRLREKSPLLSRFLFAANIALALFTVIFVLRILQVVL